MDAAGTADDDVATARRAIIPCGTEKLPTRPTPGRVGNLLGRCRRLSKDREKSVRSSESFIKLAMIQLMLNRLVPSETDAEFHYRKAA